MLKRLLLRNRFLKSAYPVHLAKFLFVSFWVWPTSYIWLSFFLIPFEFEWGMTLRTPKAQHMWKVFDPHAFPSWIQFIKVALGLAHMFSGLVLFGFPVTMPHQTHCFHLLLAQALITYDIHICFPLGFFNVVVASNSQNKVQLPAWNWRWPHSCITKTWKCVFVGWGFVLFCLLRFACLPNI